MKKVCVITGGGSGMGLATAKILGKDHYIIISGRTVSKLEGAIKELKDLGIEAEAFPCDVSDFFAVERLARRANEVGHIEAVIHAAGLSPHMGDAQKLMEVNALGTIYVNDVFHHYMKEGSCLIDVASMSGYMAPEFLMPKGSYRYSRIDPQVFMRKMMRRVNLFPKKLRAAMSYAISKNFVIWFAKSDAMRYGEKGIRVLSVSPGSFETPMGEAEKDLLGDHLAKSAIPRLGKVEEIAELLAFCVDKRMGYLTGTDILCDGGCVASRMRKTGYEPSELEKTQYAVE